MRDVQMSKVYAWERVAFPWALTKYPMTPRETRTLIQAVFDDVTRAGGFAPDAPAIKFTKRNGSACASWRQLNFTAKKITQHVVLHEVAHALTYYPAMSVSARVRITNNQDLTPIQAHAIMRFCPQGHGPRWVACYIALLEKYAGIDGEKALQTARFFSYEGWGPWQVVGHSKGNDGRLYTHKQRKRERKHASVKVDLLALAYWRNLLNKGDA